LLLLLAGIMASRRYENLLLWRVPEKPRGAAGAGDTNCAF
jgi:hypothetical protein